MQAGSEPTIDAFKLAQTGAAIEGSVALALLPRLASSLADTQGGLSYAVTGTSAGGPGADLRISAVLQLTCQRCGQPLKFELDRVTSFRFARDEAELASWPIEEDVPDAILGSTHLPLLPWIEDEAILSLPLVPRHDDCAVPGGERAYAPARNPFGVLAGLRIEPSAPEAKPHDLDDPDDRGV